MTVIIAQTSQYGCSMYFDSAAAGSDTVMTAITPKAFRHAGNGLVGVAGSWRVINIVSELQRRKVTPKLIVDTLKAVKGEDESLSDMEILCAWPNKPLVIIQNDFSVIEVQSSFMAIGSGAPYALGYLEAINSEGREIADEDLQGAVVVTAKYSPTVIEPVKNLYCA
jgi:ATP-dependent protease HslVU (ClpYQ) peptidase subunit